jgi:hypothetical protein
MIGVVVPRAVQVVRHDVNKIQRFGKARHIVAFVDAERGGWHGSRQKPIARLEHD